MRRFILFLTIIFCAIFTLLHVGRLTAETAQEKPLSSAQANARFTKVTNPIDMIKQAARRAYETLKGMIFKGDEGARVAEKRDELMREKVEEEKEEKLAEESTQDR